MNLRGDEGMLFKPTILKSGESQFIRKGLSLSYSNDLTNLANPDPD